MLWFKRIDDLKARTATAVQTDWEAGTWPMGKLNETVWPKTNWQADQRVMKMTLDRPARRPGSR